MRLNVKPSEKRPYRDRPGDHTCVGLQEIEVEILSGPVVIRSYCRDGQWQTLEGVEELMGQAIGGPAHAALCQYGPRRGILIYGGSLGLSLAGSGVPVIWTEKAADLPESTQKELAVERFVAAG